MKHELDKHLDVLRRYALVLMRDPEQAEDLVQEAVLKAIEGAETFQKGRDLRTWLLAIVHNCFVSRWRRRQAEGQAAGALTAFTEPYVPPSQTSRVQLGQTMTALMALPVEQREVLVLVALDGMTYRDAAECLGVPVGTVMSRLARAREALRSAIDETRQDKPADRPRPSLRVVKQP